MMAQAASDGSLVDGAAPKSDTSYALFTTVKCVRHC